MRLLLSFAALLLAGCAATSVPLHGVPCRVVLTAGEPLPEDLHADSCPDVIVLLLISGDNRTAVVESAVEDLHDAMDARGFDWGRRLPLGACLGAYKFQFFGRPCDVLATTAVSVCCLASKILFEASIPFDWGMSNGFYLSVPSAFARDARGLLRADARIPVSSVLGGSD
jgi:hypothetical protein